MGEIERIESKKKRIYFDFFGRCHPEVLGYTSQRKGCSIKLLHYDDNKNEVTVQVVNFDRHIFLK